MIDRRLLREQPDVTIDKLKKKEPNFDAQRLVKLEHDVNTVQQEVEALRQERNTFSEKGKSGVTKELREQAIELGKRLKDIEARLKTLKAAFMDLYLASPNIPFDDVPVGGEESNRVIREEGSKQTFSFEPKHHLELATKLGWLDFETAAMMTGSQFPLYKGEGVSLLYALTMFMIKNNMKHGYTPVLPPLLVNETSLFVAGNFPKFRDQVYALTNDDLYLIPTAEVSLLNMYRNQILSSKELPLRLTTWTSCFRREAGGYGAMERGLIRMHQFEKVEIFSFCEPEQSQQELDRIVACAEDILKALDLHYRVNLLATEEISFPSAKTYDIEVWMPGQKTYSEVSSCSNCTDFQARRGAIRYRKNSTTKPKLLHTLNGSSLALSRLMVALIETYQQKNGTITIPDVLKNEGIF